MCWAFCSLCKARNFVHCCRSLVSTKQVSSDHVACIWTRLNTSDKRHRFCLWKRTFSKGAYEQFFRASSTVITFPVQSNNKTKLRIDYYSPKYRIGRYHRVPTLTGNTTWKTKAKTHTVVLSIQSWRQYNAKTVGVHRNFRIFPTRVLFHPSKPAKLLSSRQLELGLFFIMHE